MRLREAVRTGWLRLVPIESSDAGCVAVIRLRGARRGGLVRADPIESIETKRAVAIERYAVP